MSLLDQIKLIASNFFKNDAQIASERKAALEVLAADPKLQAIRDGISANTTDDTKAAIASVTNIAELKQCIYDIITCNEMRMHETERTISKIVQEGTEETDKVRAGGLTTGEKTRALQRIKRLGTRHESMQQRLTIYQDNISLHMSLLDKIQEMAAMDLKGISSEQVEELEFDYEDIQEKHRELLVAEKSLFSKESMNIGDTKEKEELASLEKAILGEKKENSEPEQPSPSPVATEVKPRKRPNRRSKKIEEESKKIEEES